MADEGIPVLYSLQWKGFSDSGYFGPDLETVSISSWAPEFDHTSVADYLRSGPTLP